MPKLLPANYHSNTTFNENTLLDTLTEIKKRSYSYIESVQRDLVGYQKFDFKISDFRLDRSSKTTFTTMKRYVLSVPKQLIPTSNKERYKKSNLFMKEISIKEIAQNYKIFPYSFLVFIDGTIYTNLKLIIGEDVSRVILYLNSNNVSDGIDESLYKKLLAKDAKVTIFFIPNSIYADYATNKYVVSKFKNEIPAERFMKYGDLTGSTISYSIVSNDKSGANSVMVGETDMSRTISINSNFTTYLNSSFVNIGVITFKHFDRIIEIPEGGDYFELPIREHVVPLTSFMGFYDEEGLTKFYHDLDITYHYPNIYKVSGNTKPLKLHVFYYEPSDDAHFINEMDLYYRFFGDTILQKYKSGTIPDAVKNYVPKEFPVSIRLFEKSIHYGTPIDYTTDTLHQYIESESKNLGIYLKNMMKNRRKMRLHVKTVDLPSKLRTNVMKEFPNLDVTFDEERYVFVFSKYFVYDYNLRFFIDGLFYHCDQTYDDKDYYYFYIPTTLIKSDTIIDIEKHRSVRHDFQVTLNTDTIDMKIEENPYLASDAMFINADGDLINEDLFHFIITENKEEIEIDSSSHKPLPDNFKIKVLDNAYINVPMTILFKRLSAVYELKITSEDDADRAMLFKTNISRHAGHIRIFRNGRILPPNVYNVIFKSNVNEYNVISFTRKKIVGDVYHIEINPDVLYENYYTAEIGTDAMLDFGGRLNKPFELKWFDVYLNGYKLDERNFDILTPRYVLIKNVKSVSHLLIMEKNWKDDIFKFRTTKEEIIPPEFVINSCTDDDLLEIDDELKQAIEDIKEEIIVDDTIPELLPDIIEDLSDDLAKLMASMLRHVFNIDTFINPDVDKTRDNLPTDIENAIIKNDNIVKVFPNVVPNVNVHVVFNPDKALFDPDIIEQGDGIIID